MRNILKKSSVLIAVLMVAMLFAGISCFAYEQEAIPTEAEASVSEITDNEAVETQEIQIYESKSSEDKSLGKNLAMGIGSGFVIALIVCICIYFSYKKHGATEPYKYDENAKLTLIDSSDVLVNTHIEKRKIEKDNND
ncbi:MAG: hypothetical protein SOT80_01745 [Candidatus Pseudoruminococcus sp.]|uniref:hypothetical protein n=1 Tax=Candidatus Pseudoruminococcus sp. TaxID=3101048 RepID=UPI002A7E5E96|nr:hypothetical protein [Ruminococcus sp.]MDY2782107.1 hypothetical protein [Candidatus Pseudoruminococcus sp.]